MGRLEGKSVIITGAGSGIGRAASLLFTKEGARLIAVDRTEAVKDTVELSEAGVVSKERLFGGDERGVEDGERGEFGCGAQLRGGGDGGAHVTSARAAATWSAVTVLALATAAAMRP